MVKIKAEFMLPDLNYQKSEVNTTQAEKFVPGNSLCVSSMQRVRRANSQPTHALCHKAMKDCMNRTWNCFRIHQIQKQPLFPVPDLMRMFTGKKSHKSENYFETV